MPEKDNRLYNVFFNTHTVSGIVISIGLYVIFLAGAFALFQNNINNWEINAPEKSISANLDYDRILRNVEEKGYQMYGRDFRIDLRHNNGKYLNVSADPPAKKIPADSLQNLSKEDSVRYAASIARINFIVDPYTYALSTPDPDNGPNQRIGRLLTRLHYFDQIPFRIGLYLSGLVALFFLFAVVTGIVVHWKKIISNFFTFRLRSSIKNLWTDAHTALGVIGLPFQVMYAVTGTFFGLGIVLLPIVMIVFDGDNDKATEILVPSGKTYELKGESTRQVAIAPLVKQVLEEVEPEEIAFFQVLIKSYADQNAHLDVVLNVNTKEDFAGQATATFKLSDGTVIAKESHRESTFRTGSLMYFIKLHFGSFGGHLVRGIYFILAVLTCFVIISGVMIWLTAREKKMYAHKAKFNRNVGAIYLGACLGLFPAIALLFIIAKSLPLDMEGRFDMINYVFFGFWLVYTIYAFVIKNYFVINKHALVLAGVLGLAIPFINGIVTGLWFWKSLGMGYTDSFFVDVAWLCLSLITLTAAFKAKPIVKRKVIEQDTSALSEEIPVQKKNKAVLSGIKEKAPVLGIKPTQG